MGRKGEWTPEQISQLIKLMREKRTAKEVAGIMGVTKSAILGKAHRLHLKGNLDGLRFSGSYVSNSRRSARKPMAKRKPYPASHIEKQLPRPRSNGNGIDDTRDAVLALTNHTCRYPLGTPGEAGFSFCMRSIPVEQSYCREHIAITTQPERPR